MNRYLEEFLNYRCSGDILNVVNPLGHKASKEITEAVTMIKKLRLITLNYPMKYTVYDFCAGNALSSILSVHLLPVKNAIAVDKTLRDRKYFKVKRFEYLEQDIYQFDESTIPEDSIVTAIHSCGDLAKRICDIYLNSKAKYLILIPCCNGTFDIHRYPPIVREKIGKYMLWSTELMHKVNGRISIDNYCLSPKNCIITAKKG